MMTFEDTITTKADRAEYLEPDEIPPMEVGGAQELRKYLQFCFRSDEHVAICVETAGTRPGKMTSFPVSHLLSRCDRTDKMDEIVGTTDPRAGAWIGCNPVDENGCRDKNVTAYRHALLKTDGVEAGNFFAMVHQLQFPCACVLHSGDECLHAIVRIEADSIQQYRERIDFLYKTAEKAGLKCDAGNRYPSRLTRLPGVQRGENWQYVVSGPCGKDTWSAWKEYADDLYDDLPDIECAVDFIHNPPPRLPEIIEGVLRKTHKMRVSGPPKAGKSFALEALAIAVAEGAQWLGFDVHKGSVLLVNTELDTAEQWNRLKEVYDALGIDPSNANNIDVWNLRGNCRTLEVLAPKLIGRAKQRAVPYDIIILDPIYKVAGADENNPEDVAALCDCMDRIALAIGAAFVYCHHHSKGMQGQKTSMDRASGSGVFSRDADTMLDFVELQLSKQRRVTLTDKLIREELRSEASINGFEFEEIEKAAGSIAQGFLQKLQQAYPANQKDFARVYNLAESRSLRMSGWRIEGTFRSFAPMDPHLFWFRWPIHVPDTLDLLKDAKAAGEEPPWMDASRKKEEYKNQRKEEEAEKLEGLDEAVKAKGVGCTLKDLSDVLGVGERSVRRYLSKSDDWKVVKGCVQERV